MKMPLLIKQILSRLFLPRKPKKQRQYSSRCRKDDDSTFRFKHLALDEQEVVIDEIYQRWQDMVFMNAKDHIRETFERHPYFSNLATADEINLCLSINMVVGDIVQVLGRYRRSIGRTVEGESDGVLL